MDHPIARQTPWSVISPFRFPFVRPRIPSLARVEFHFQAARDASFFSNFGPVSFALETAIREAFFPWGRIVACSNCTSGLSAALLALRVEGPVLIPAFTFPATASAVLGAGLRPVVCDVTPRGATLDPAGIEPAIKEFGIRAVIAVRPYGMWSDLTELAETCRRHRLPLVIDNAAGLGVGTPVIERYAIPGVTEVFSLHATKPFGIGEGGLIWCPAFLEDDMRSALNFGLWAAGTLPRGRGLNGKMDELTAAMARTVLEDIPKRIAQRQAMATRLIMAANQAGLESVCRFGREEEAPWQCFPIHLPHHCDVGAVVAACAVSGLQVRRYYHPLVTDDALPARFPIAQEFSDRAVCLPVYDGVAAACVDEIWDIFHRALI